MRVHTLLATTVAGALLAGMTGVPATADPGRVLANRSGHLETWGTASAADAITVPGGLAGQQIVSVSASDNATGVVTAEGHLSVWGKDTADEAIWAPSGLTDVASVSLGFDNGIALKDDDTVVAWGSTVGIDAVPDGLSAKAISMSSSGTAYAVTTGGALTWWGTAPNPAPPGDLTDLVDVSASSYHVLALDAGGNVTAWGPLAAAAPPPAEIQGQVAQIATGGTVSGAILDDGSIRLWGIGAPAVPAELAGQRVVALDVHSNATAVTEDGQVHVWGPTADLTTVPVALDGEHVAAVAIGQNHAAAIVTDFRAVDPPMIDGQPRVGQTLTATPADLSLEPDAPATGQWLADGEPIGGQTDTTLAVDETLLDQTISYRTTATRGEETVESTSDEVGPVGPATVDSTTKVDVTRNVGSYGAARKATATVTTEDGPATGKVTFTLGSLRATKSLTNGKATWWLPRTLSVGTRRVTAHYNGNGAIEPSTSAAARVTIRKVGSNTNANAKYKKRKKKAVVKARVRANTRANVNGKVQFKLKRGKKTIAKKKDRLNKRDLAKVVFKRKHLRRNGKYKVIIKYLGTNNIKKSSDRVQFRVRR